VLRPQGIKAYRELTRIARHEAVQSERGDYCAGSTLFFFFFFFLPVSVVFDAVFSCFFPTAA
jgi:hypothetical protein